MNFFVNIFNTVSEKKVKNFIKRSLTLSIVVKEFLNLFLSFIYFVLNLFILKEEKAHIWHWLLYVKLLERQIQS